MSKHTPEPWVRSSDDFIAAESDQLNNGEYVLSCFGPDQAANARRIVACVNACAGLPTEHLESAPLGGILNGVAGLVSQRDELLAALEDLFHETSHENLRKAQEVIAKAKGI